MTNQIKPSTRTTKQVKSADYGKKVSKYVSKQLRETPQRTLIAVGLFGFALGAIISRRS